MSNDLSFVHYRSYTFDRKLYARATGIDLEKVKSISYVVRGLVNGKSFRLAKAVVERRNEQGQVVNHGCGADFEVETDHGDFNITPTVTWTDAAGGGSQQYGVLVFRISEGEATRSFEELIPLDVQTTRKKRSAGEPFSFSKVPPSWALHDEMLQGHAEINRSPAVGPLVVEFTEGGIEHFEADLEPSSGSRLDTLWPRLKQVIEWSPLLSAQERVDPALAALKDYYRIEQPASMFNDTFIALGKTLASLSYVQFVELQGAAEPPTPGWLRGLGLLAGTLVPGGWSNRLLNPPPEEPTSDFESLQRYLNEPGPTIKGLNIRNAWANRVIGKGARIHLVDAGLDVSHEDLRGNPQLHFVERGPNHDPVHGNASAGLLVATANGFGTTGITHGAELDVYSSRAENEATGLALIAKVQPGDIVICNLEFADKVRPISMLPAVHSKGWWKLFDILVKRGAVVLCAAGNGHIKDDAETGAVAGKGVELNAWPDFRAHEDAGVILVGGSRPDNGKPHAWSNFNYQYRMLNAWGSDVVTLGMFRKNDLQNMPGTDRDYTDFYNGTSAATPMVGGALALIQSYAMQQHHLYLDCKQMHLLVTASGYTDATLDTQSSPPMGVRPNVYGAMVLLDTLLGGGRLPPEMPEKDEL